MPKYMALTTASLLAGKPLLLSNISLLDYLGSANLNSNYFENRRDRYLSFTNHENFANYCHSFLKVVSKFSFRLTPQTASSPLEPYSYQQEDYVVSWSGPNAAEHPHYINGTMEQALTNFQQSHKSLLSAKLDAPSVKLLPIIQAGQFNVREEEATMKLLFEFIRGAQTRPRMNLTSGYFNLYKAYQNYLLDTANLDCTVIAASPKVSVFRVVACRVTDAHSPHRRTGFMGPEAYRVEFRKATRFWSAGSWRRSTPQEQV